MLTVHLRINDSATAKPTPVRFRISGPDGATYAPLGRFEHFPTGRNEAVGGHLKLGSERWFYIDGSCEVPLPAGIPLRVQASKGPEYKPLDETVSLGPGQVSLRFSIVRAFNWREAGYHPGDTRCHFLSPHAGLLEAMAEDLDTANALAIPFDMLALDGNTYTTYPDLLAFSGQQPALSAPPDHTFSVNTLNSHPVLGKVGLLHSHRAIFPLAFGGPDDTDDWSISDWCDQCHRKGGLTVWVDAFEPAGGITGGEGLVAAILGKIDAIEIAPGQRTSPLLPWLYRLWNAGIWVPIAGGSGKDSNGTPLGAMRTYARIQKDVEGEFNSRAWIESVRAGRTFVTSGPLVDLEVEGHRPGEITEVGEAIEIRAKAESIVPIHHLEIVANGTVIASLPAQFDSQMGYWSAEVRHTYTIGESSWIAARSIGKETFAHTSFLRIKKKDSPFQREDEAVTALKRLLEQTGEWGELHGRYNNAKRREQFLDRCRHAAEKLG